MTTIVLKGVHSTAECVFLWVRPPPFKHPIWLWPCPKGYKNMRKAYFPIFPALATSPSLETGSWKHHWIHCKRPFQHFPTMVFSAPMLWIRISFLATPWSRGSWAALLSLGHNALMGQWANMKTHHFQCKNLRVGYRNSWRNENCINIHLQHLGTCPSGLVYYSLSVLMVLVLVQVGWDFRTLLFFYSSACSFPVLQVNMDIMAARWLSCKESLWMCFSIDDEDGFKMVQNILRSSRIIQDLRVTISCNCVHRHQVPNVLQMSSDCASNVTQPNAPAKVARLGTTPLEGTWEQPRHSKQQKLGSCLVTCRCVFCDQNYWAAQGRDSNWPLIDHFERQNAEFKHHGFAAWPRRKQLKLMCKPRR